VPSRVLGCGQSAWSANFSRHQTRCRPRELDAIAQHELHRILVEDSEVVIRQQVHLQSLQLQTQFSRLVVNGERAVVGQTSLGTYRGIFREARGDLVAEKLIGPGLQLRQLGVDTSPGVLGRVVRHRASPRCYSTSLHMAQEPGEGLRLPRHWQSESCLAFGTSLILVPNIGKSDGVKL